MTAWGETRVKWKQVLTARVWLYMSDWKCKPGLSFLLLNHIHRLFLHMQTHTHIHMFTCTKLFSIIVVVDLDLDLNSCSFHFFFAPIKIPTTNMSLDRYSESLVAMGQSLEESLPGPWVPYIWHQRCRSHEHTSFAFKCVVHDVVNIWSLVIIN